MWVLDMVMDENNFASDLSHREEKVSGVGKSHKPHLWALLRTVCSLVWSSMLANPFQAGEA